MPRFSGGVNITPDPKAVSKALREADKTLPRQLGKVNAEALEPIAADARSRAQGDGGVRAHAAEAIKASKSASQLAITVSASGAHPEALGAYLGAKRYRQFPEWVGADWEVGESGGIYDINPAIAAGVNDLMDRYGDAVDQFVSDAFDGTGEAT